jgi:hypothetical protein
MEYFLQKKSKWILYLMGWETFHDQGILSNHSNQKLIMTFSHTSIWDGIIFLLYRFAYPETLGKMNMFLNSKMYDSVPSYFQPMMQKLGFIRTTAYEDDKGGLIKNVYEQFKNHKSLYLLISPKGKRIKSHWRTGYYVMAKLLDCKILACGLDYEKKKVILFEPISIEDKQREQVEPILQKQLEDIIPLNPECSEVGLRKFKKQNIGIVAFSFAILFLLLFFTYLSIYYKLLFIIILFILFLLF